MANNGFWAVDIGDGIKLSQVDVSFDNKGRLEVTLPAGAPFNWTKQLSMLVVSETRFQVKIERPRVITATFHQCLLVGSSKGPTLAERTGGLVSAKGEDTTRSMSFKFEYLTSD